MNDEIKPIGGPGSIQPVEKPSGAGAPQEKRQANQQLAKDKLTLKKRSPKLEALYEDLQKLQTDANRNWLAKKIDIAAIKQEIDEEERKLEYDEVK